MILMTKALCIPTIIARSDCKEGFALYSYWRIFLVLFEKYVKRRLKMKHNF